MTTKKLKPEYVEHTLTIVAGAWHRALSGTTLCRRDVNVETVYLHSALDIPHCLRCYPSGHLGCPR
jgi:hypothetical protein